MNFDFSKYSDELLFVPLGGSNEIGMNLNLYTMGGKWLMIDCGIGFANDYLPGIDIIVPDISFIVEHKEDLLGLVLTHAHEDHVGAVPHLWRELECPIYATPFTANFLEHKIREMGPGPKPEVHEVATGSSLELGPFSLDLLELTHSIPEMQAIAISTKAGVVMHTGDWKFDDNPLIGPESNYDKLEKYGDGSVMAMVCDSTNVFEEGESGSEGEVRKHLTEVIDKCTQRVVVTTFASNLARVSTIIQAAYDAGRVVTLMGRSLHRVVATAKESGYLSTDCEFVTDKEAMDLPRQDVLVLCTGCQGEPRAALTRMAKGEHPHMRLQSGDTVIYSSRKIPGNENKIGWVHNRLVERGVEVITDKDFYIHVSGHPAREELIRMYELVRPQIAVPTHGEARHLHEHAALARSLGVKETVEARNGAIVWLAPGEASIIGDVESGYMAIEGSSLIPIDSEIIRKRRRLRDEGIIFVSLVLDTKGELQYPVQIAAPGVLDSKEDEELIEEYLAELTHALSDYKNQGADKKVTEQVRKTLRRLLKQGLGKKPLIEVFISRIDV